MFPIGLAIPLSTLSVLDSNSESPRFGSNSADGLPKLSNSKVLRGLQVQIMGFLDLDVQPFRDQVVKTRIGLSFALERVTLHAGTKNWYPYSLEL